MYLPRQCNMAGQMSKVTNCRSDGTTCTHSVKTGGAASSGADLPGEPFGQHLVRWPATGGSQVRQSRPPGSAPTPGLSPDPRAQHRPTGSAPTHGLSTDPRAQPRPTGSAPTHGTSTDPRTQPRPTGSAPTPGLSTDPRAQHPPYRP